MNDTKASKNKGAQFSDDEKAAMKERAKELKAEAARGKDADAENELSPIATAEFGVGATAATTMPTAYSAAIAHRIRRGLRHRPHAARHRGNLR